MLSSTLRERFLAFFERHEHRRMASHSLVPPADPTLLFVNAGMVQFKDIFVGLKKVDFKCATSSQKCLRVSGKHNDLENVGRTARHHTFFEMLGNFSFGDYFKAEAIRFAYEFLVEDIGLDPKRCYYTVFGGDEADGIGADVEAEKLWMEIAGVGPEQLLRFGKKDNFWAMGETGPCGPCSEILYDRGPGPWACGEAGCAPGCDCDRYMEIWNLVFMQFERKEPGGPLGPLPAPSIDTGMGLERLAAITQNKPTNYETDLFMPLIERTIELVEEATGRRLEYPCGDETDVGLRVIADHSRAVTFLVADGVYPDNEGRGYITRLLARRAVRFGKKLGFKGPFLYKVCDLVVDTMQGAYPDLAGRRQVVQKVVTLEEESFNRTYLDGLVALHEYLERQLSQGRAEVDGEFLFRLHDERGLQIELVEILVEDFVAERDGVASFSLDVDGYRNLMAAKKLASGKVAESVDSGAEETYRAIADRVGATRFVGYEQADCRTEVLAAVKGGREVASLQAGDEGEVVLKTSAFYAESGGQVGDSGYLTWERGRAAVVQTVKTPGDVYLHRVKVENGELALGAKVHASPDAGRRAGISAHHSGTHLLHFALGQVLGEHVKQEGSLVKADLFRFDFRHFSPLTLKELQGIERLVARLVLKDTVVTTETKSLEDAVATGAKAFFDEKYGESVRLVAMADGASIELCGGTHVERTGQVGLLKIIRQEAVSSGVRRIYAVCHEAAFDHVVAREGHLRTMAASLKTSPDEVGDKVARLVDRNSQLEKTVKQLEQKLLAGATEEKGGGYDIEEVGKTKIGYAMVEDADDSKVRTMSDMLRDRIKDGIVLVGGIKQGKLMFVVAKTAGAPQGFHCGNAVRKLAAVVEGRGGGKPDFGQAGGGNPEKWSEAVALLKEVVQD